MGAPGRAESPGLGLVAHGASLLLASLLGACGGSTTHQDAPAVGSTATGGSAAGPQSGGPEPTPAWLADMRLDEAFPWFKQDHGGSYGMLPPSNDGTVTVALEGQPIESTISTHNHLEVLSRVSGVAFRARADASTRLQVSVKSSLDADYFGALDEGRTWPVRSVAIRSDWEGFEVPLTQLAPADSPEDPAGLPAFTVAFVVEAASGPVTLQLDDVRFF